MAPNLESTRHSLSHVLAMAIKRLYPNVKFGIGPVVENGFYQDILLDKPISSKDLPKIEAEMLKIVKEDLPFKQITVPRAQAVDMLNMQGQIFKTEILNSVVDENVSFYQTGNEFIDLCRGPHISHTGQISNFKLIELSSSYWNNDPKRPQMQRIYGVAFENVETLNSYLEALATKLKSSHPVVGERSNYFKVSGSDAIFFEKGTASLKLIQNLLFRTNTIYEFDYTQSSATALKPQPTEQVELSPYFDQMVKQYKAKKQSYRSLPYKTVEIKSTNIRPLGANQRGLFGLNNFTKEYKTIICTKKQLEGQLKTFFDISTQVYESFELKLDHIKYKFPIAETHESTKNTKEIDGLAKIVDGFLNKIDTKVIEVPNRDKTMGPGFTFVAKDALGKEIELGYIYIDLHASTKLKLRYVSPNNTSKQPYLLKASTINSMESILALILEQSEGAFPIWLSPVQVQVIPVSEKFNDYATEVRKILIENDILVGIDTKPETMQNKIRKAQEEMIPYMLIVGEKELSTKTVSVRPRSDQDLGIMKIDEFINRVKQDIEDRKIF